MSILSIFRMALIATSVTYTDQSRYHQQQGFNFTRPIVEVTSPLNRVLSCDLNSEQEETCTSLRVDTFGEGPLTNSSVNMHTSTLLYATGLSIFDSFDKSMNSVRGILLPGLKDYSTHGLLLTMELAFSKSSDLQSALGSILGRAGRPLGVSSIAGVILNWNMKTCSDETSGGSSLTTLSNILRHSTQVGVGYDRALVGCPFLAQDLRLADIVLLNVHFDSKTFPESYGLFCDHMNWIEKRNSAFMAEQGTDSKRKVQVIFRMRFVKDMPAGQTSEQIENRYIHLFSAFSQTWANEYNQTVSLEYHSSISSVLNGREPNVKTHIDSESLIPLIAFPYECDGDSFKKMFNFVQESFTRMVLEPYSSEAEVWSETSECLNRNSSAGQSHFEQEGARPNVAVLVDWEDNRYQFTQLSDFLSQSLFNDNFRLTSLIFSDRQFDPGFWRELNPQQIRPFFQTWSTERNLSIGCAFSNWKSMGNNTNDIRKAVCPQFADFINTIVLNTQFDVEKLDWRQGNALEFYADLKGKMTQFLETREVISREFPNKEFILLVEASFEDAGVKSDRKENLFCSKQFLTINQCFEAVARWARIHNVTVIWKDKHRNPTSNWEALNWNELKVSRDLKSVPKADSLFIKMRNFPETVIMRGKQLPDPCVHWSLEPNGDAIKFDETFVGASVDLELRHESVPELKELKMMLRFAFHKFSRLEVRIRENIDSILSALTAVLSEDAYSKKEIKFFLRVELSSKVEMNEFGRKFGHWCDTIGSSKLKQNFGGIHVVNWEQFRNNTQLQSLLEAEVHKGFEIGAMVQNCAHEITLLYSSSHKIKSSLLHRVSYVVCEQPQPDKWFSELSYLHPLDDDKEYLAELLDEQIIVESLLKKNARNLKGVHFKLNIFSKTNTDLEDRAVELYLKLVNDVNQFARIYKINYFLVQVFDNTVDQLHFPGWWRLENDTDLGNSSNYIDKETEYFDWEPRWKPEVVDDPTDEGESEENGESNYLVIILALTSVLLLAVALFYGIRHRKLSNLLTDDDVREFLEGWQASTQNEEENVYAFQKSKFLSEFEIPKIELQLDSGNFAKVFKSSVEGTAIAVKVPHSTCSKESFISMLREVKVLCYIGRHQNVVAFIGAYTKEIRKGIILIATELCSNGSLLSLLRKSNGTSETAENKLELYELLRFASEIASGMEYISSKHVIHGDLATRNVLLDENTTCKIGDFGLSRKLYEYEMYLKKSQEPLPWRWMAYESLTRMEFTTKSDVWSYGVTLWEIFSQGDLPYPGLSWSSGFPEELKSGMRMDRPRYADEHIYNQMLACWNIDMEMRPEFQDMADVFNEMMKKEYVAL